MTMTTFIGWAELFDAVHQAPRCPLCRAMPGITVDGQGDWEAVTAHEADCGPAMASGHLLRDFCRATDADSDDFLEWIAQDAERQALWARLRDELACDDVGLIKAGMTGWKSRKADQRDASEVES